MELENKIGSIDLELRNIQREYNGALPSGDPYVSMLVTHREKLLEAASSESLLTKARVDRGIGGGPAEPSAFDQNVPDLDEPIYDVSKPVRTWTLDQKVAFIADHGHAAFVDQLSKE